MRENRPLIVLRSTPFFMRKKFGFVTWEQMLDLNKMVLVQIFNAQLLLYENLIMRFVGLLLFPKLVNEVNIILPFISMKKLLALQFYRKLD